MYVMIRKSIKHPEELVAGKIKPMKLWLAIIMVLGGLGALIAGADLIVPSAVRIAEVWGVSQSVIGLTIVALGTSLPELATSVVAAFKKNSDIALGNVIGSNIFNIFLVLRNKFYCPPTAGLQRHDDRFTDCCPCKYFNPYFCKQQQKTSNQALARRLTLTYLRRLSGLDDFKTCLNPYFLFRIISKKQK